MTDTSNPFGANRKEFLEKFTNLLTFIYDWYTIHTWKPLISQNEP